MPSPVPASASALHCRRDTWPVDPDYGLGIVVAEQAGSSDVADGLGESCKVPWIPSRPHDDWPALRWLRSRHGRRLTLQSRWGPTASCDQRPSWSIRDSPIIIDDLGAPTPRPPGTRPGHDALELGFPHNPEPYEAANAVRSWDDRSAGSVLVSTYQHRRQHQRERSWTLPEQKEFPCWCLVTSH